MTETANKCTPWVEKYRPIDFDNIVLDPVNRTILENIIKTSHFPNLLFYGPPGTGKTTTILNLINAYQQKHNQCQKGFMIHLNASDVNSKNLFMDGMKFVVLDVVDYMTKNAQQALRYLLQSYTVNVRFCLICNYVSRIDDGLQNEFIKLRFNQLPETDIILFLNKITIMENLNLTVNDITLIKRLYKSDIRSMVNFMQSNQNVGISEFGLNIIEDNMWSTLYAKLQTNDIPTALQYINEISVKCNVIQKNIIKDFADYIIRTYPITTDFLSFVECIMHFTECNESYYLNYSLLRLASFINKL